MGPCCCGWEVVSRERGGGVVGGWDGRMSFPGYWAPAGRRFRGVVHPLRGGRLSMRVGVEVCVCVRRGGRDPKLF